MSVSSSGNPLRFDITGRALLVSERRLLLVSHGEYWYTPGGRAIAGERLPDCVRREVWEETGIEVEVRELLHVAEYLERARNRHKVEMYFLAHAANPSLADGWTDTDGGRIIQRRFFGLAELRSGLNCQPAFLTEGTWLRERAGGTYMGYEER